MISNTQIKLTKYIKLVTNPSVANFDLVRQPRRRPNRTELKTKICQSSCNLDARKEYTLFSVVTCGIEKWAQFSSQVVLSNSNLPQVNRDFWRPSYLQLKLITSLNFHNSINKILHPWKIRLQKDLNFTKTMRKFIVLFYVIITFDTSNFYLDITL